MSFEFLHATITEQLVRIVALLFTIVLHELGHGYMALAMGDTTAKDAGRLSLNPLKHLDPIGVICMLLFRFGWAKPVPINSYRFRDRKAGMFLVSIAGITVNMILAFFSALFLFYFQNYRTLSLFFTMMLMYNVFFAVFNALPLPPLDGSKILASFLPERIMDWFLANEKYLYIILMILIFTNLISRIISPIAGFVMDRFLLFWARILI